jgi:hypothetical protein
MAIPGTYEFIVGLTIGKILLGALFASPLFRNFAFAGAATGICLLYSREGLSGVLTIAHSLQADFATRPDFTKGVVLGALIAAVVLGLFRRRNVL